MDRQQNIGISQFSFALPHAPLHQSPGGCAHIQVFMAEKGEKEQIVSKLELPCATLL